MKKQYQSEILKVCHETAVDMHQIGVISDEEMREYDRDCLVPPKTPSPGVFTRTVIPAMAQPRS